MDRNQTLTQENDSLRGENQNLLAELTAERTRAAELADAKSVLESRNDELKAELAQARERIELDEEVFAELQRRNIEAYRVIQQFKTYPDIEGRVVTVDPETNLVVLSVGSKDQVRKNFEFTVYRDDDFVATVNVFDVREDKCAARIVARKQPVQVGDFAATRILF
jgi:hypothetical protein